jgi:AcrR family transcriptional regulator
MLTLSISMLEERSMGARRPRIKTAYHHGNLRQDLVTAAVQLITRKGPEALTLRAVARRLGVSQTAPYRHFPSKEALLAAVAADGFSALLAATRAEIDAAGPDVIERYQAMGVAYVRFALACPAHFQVMYGPRPPEFMVGAVAEAGRAAFQLLCDIIVACQQAGRAPPGDPTRIAVEAWSLVHGLATLYLHGLLPRRLEADEVRALGAQIALFLRPGADE